jgi:hypothetical protein
MYDTLITKSRLVGMCMAVLFTMQPLPVWAQNDAENAVESVELTPVGQEDATNTAADDVAVPQEAQEQEAFSLIKDNDIDPARIPSLFFTGDALALLKDAINGLITSRMAGGEEGKEPGIRELALGGIVYRAGDDWTIWLNGRRVTPDAIPEQVYDLNVSKTYVDIKWYDAYTNRLYPVRLRANQRFNLDSRLFLTGTHGEDQQL